MSACQIRSENLGHLLSILGTTLGLGLAGRRYKCILNHSPLVTTGTSQLARRGCTCISAVPPIRGRKNATRNARPTCAYASHTCAKCATGSFYPWRLLPSRGVVARAALGRPRLSGSRGVASRPRGAQGLALRQGRALGYRKRSNRRWVPGLAAALPQDGHDGKAPLRTVVWPWSSIL